MGHSRPGRHGLRHRPRQPAQVLLASRTAAAGRAPGRSRSPSGSSPSCRVPQVVRRERRQRRRPAASTSTTTRPKSIGRLRGFAGQLRRLRPLLRLHPQPRRRRPRRGVRDRRPERQLPDGPPARRAAPAGTCRSPSSAPACTSSSSPAARRSASSSVKTLDIAKRLLDYGFHPPTVYFPLLVDEALMVEPTETETKESLDALRRRDRGDPRRGRGGPGDRPNAPYTTPVRRLDEARASRRPVVRQPLG